MKLARSLWIIQKFILCCLLASGAAQAQIVPDATLGNERSRVAPIDGKSDQIKGGALRGVNLFHSFMDFNVGEGRSAYFANPDAVQNIFSRVTGSNLSKIDGTLGVLGKANLFLLNPNGIIFGPKAQLDVSGSFFASTASGFKFSDGSEFSATNPQEAPMLTVSLTPGLQRGGEEGAIANEGKLTVGKDLTLSGGTVTSPGQLSAPQGQLTVEATAGDARVRNIVAQTATLYANNNLILEESQLRTTGDLDLLAQNTVRVRDSVVNPFLAQAGGNLHIQGNQGIDILALNHPQTPFVSGSNLNLVSDGIISGDSHFNSGGSFAILNLAGGTGKFTSLYDPIIRSMGDVIFGSYTGSALKVEAVGSIIVENRDPNDPNNPNNSNNFAAIRITGGDPSVTVSDPDIAVLSTLNLEENRNGRSKIVDYSNSPALILRAGLNPSQISSPSSLPTGTGGTTFRSEGITRESFSSRGGQLPRGSIQIQGSIDTSSGVGDGGPVILSAVGDIEITGGGVPSVPLNSTDPPPFRSSIFTNSNAGYGGPIRLIAGGDILVKGVIESSAFGSSTQNPSSNNGGSVFLSAGGDIRIQPDAFDFFRIDPNLRNLDPANRNLPRLATSIRTPAGYFSNGNTLQRNDGNGGDITLLASRNVYIERAVVYSNVGGAPYLNWTPLGLEDVRGNTGGSGASGNIVIQGNSVFIINSRLDVNAYGDRKLNPENGDSKLGSILIQANDSGIVSLAGSQLYATSFANPETIDNSQKDSIVLRGGSIKLDRRPAARPEIDDNSAALSGYFSEISLIDSTVRGSASSGNILLTSTRGSVSLFNQSLIATTVRLGGLANGGNIRIEAGTVNLDSLSKLNAETFGEAKAGSITVQGSNSVSVFGGSEINSNSGIYNPSSDYSFIKILSPQGSITLDGSTVTAKNFSPQYAGDIYINAFDRIDIKNGSTISGNGYLGRIFIGSSFPYWTERNDFVPKTVTIESSTLTTTNKVAGNTRITDLPNKVYREIDIPNDSGDIRIRTSGNLSIKNNSVIAATTSSQGNAGNIEFRAGSISFTNVPERKDSNGVPTSGISSETIGSGKAGNVFVEATTSDGLRLDFAKSLESIQSIPTAPGNTVELNNANISTSVGSASSGKGGDVFVRGYSLSMISGSGLVAKTSGTSPAKAGRIEVKVNDFVDVLSGSQLNAQTESSASAGSITVTAPNRVTLDGANGSRPTQILTKAANQGGNSGTVEINTSQLEVKNAQISSSNISGTDEGGIRLQGFNGAALNSLDVTNGLISASTERGRAGNLTVNAEGGKVHLSGVFSGDDNSNKRGGLSVEATGTGVDPTNEGIAGNIAVNTRSLKVEQGAAISASNQSAKPSNSDQFGNIVLSGLDTLEVTANSGITATTAEGKAGSLALNKGGSPANSVTLTNGRLSLEATGNGSAGNIELNTRQLTLQQDSTISAKADGRGKAGNLSIYANGSVTDFVDLSGGSSITLSSNSGDAGGIGIDARRLTLQSSNISASTQTATAGSLNVTNADSVQLNGRSSLTVRAENGGTAGNLNINTNKLTLNGRPGAVADEDKARISVSSRTGQAGNLAITANTISLDNGQLTAETGASNPSGEPTGNVYLNVQKTPDKLVFSSPIDALLLKNESLISATALEKATGGNIYINANWIFGFYPTGKDGSDITANAKFGSGGRVDIRKEGIFGLEYRRQRTSLNDITASSEFGQQGTVTFRGIDVDPTRGISPLSTVPVDPSNQINTNCTPNSTRAESRFVSVGRGGLPTNPGDPLTATATLSRLATLDSPSTAPDRSTLPSSDRPLVEAQTWVKLPNGRIRLVSQTPNSPSSWQNIPGCHGQ